MATLNTLTENVRTKLTIDPQRDIWTDSELKTYINEGITKFYAKANMKEEWKDGTISPLVASQGNYTKPTDLRRILYANLVDTTASNTDSDESSLTIITDDLLNRQKDWDMDYEADAPQYIYEEGGELWLYPVPNATAASTYTVKYKYSKRPAVLGDSDSPEIPEEWHFIFEDYAVWRAWNRLPDKVNEAANAKVIWEENWRQAMQDILTTTGETLTWQQLALPHKDPK